MSHAINPIVENEMKLLGVCVCVCVFSAAALLFESFRHCRSPSVIAVDALIKEEVV